MIGTQSEEDLLLKKRFWKRKKVKNVWMYVFMDIHMHVYVESVIALYFILLQENAINKGWKRKNKQPSSITNCKQMLNQMWEWVE
jgi:hypothetical protein